MKKKYKLFLMGLNKNANFLDGIRQKKNANLIIELNSRLD